MARQETTIADVAPASTRPLAGVIERKPNLVVAVHVTGSGASLRNCKNRGMYDDRGYEER